MNGTAKGFRVLGINHLGLAPKNPDQTFLFFTDILGLAPLGEELVKEQRTLTNMIASSISGDARKGSRLEILSPEAGTLDSPIAKFLEKKGGGIHHVALTVDSIHNAIDELKTRGVKLIDQIPRKGAHDTLIAFIHPESTGGLLVELVQEHSI